MAKDGSKKALAQGNKRPAQPRKKAKSQDAPAVASADSAELVSDSSDDGPQDQSSSGSVITSSLKPPKGFSVVPFNSDKSNALFEASLFDGPSSAHRDLIIIRVPADLPLSELNNLDIPLANDTADTVKPLAKLKVRQSAGALAKSKGKTAAAAISEYGLFSLDTPSPQNIVPGLGGETAEMNDFVPLLPDARTGGYRVCTKKFTRHFSVVPLTPKLPTEEDFSAAALSIKAVPYAERVHPNDLKLQYEPYGFSTEGEALRESLERYRKTDISAVAATAVVTPQKRKGDKDSLTGKGKKKAKK
ncbi:hypothetical protein HDU84_003553 [Entophlyctis sp. JEL0112]|nr:hypothetical protein HDU84_003553 [Entophlyctis sp. JEL0112]